MPSETELLEQWSYRCSRSRLHLTWSIPTLVARPTVAATQVGLSELANAYRYGKANDTQRMRRAVAEATQILGALMEEWERLETTQERE